MIKENEQNEKKEKYISWNNSSTRVIRSKLIQNILNEKNKIIKRKSRKSAEYMKDIGNKNNSPNFFKLGEN